MNGPEDRSKALNEHISSGFAPRADIVAAFRHVRFVPEVAVSTRSKTVALFDHLVGAGEQRRRHFEAERFGGLEIDNQLEFVRLLHRQVGRLLASEDTVDIICRSPEHVGRIRAVSHQTAAFGEMCVGIYGGPAMPSYQPRD